jgi:hypothetical protein
MEAERPEKAVVRELWMQEAQTQAASHPEDDEPLYLTLPGGEGREIHLLADIGIIELTEVGGIAKKDQHRIVAVESSLPNIAKLQRNFPGLKILEVPFQSLVHGERPTRWPSGEHEKFCRARVVNLDLNAPLSAKEEEEAIEFPVIAWIRKLAQLHAVAPRRDWSLCLTLHGELVVSSAVCEFIQQFLAENFRREQRFADACRALLGDDLFNSINAEELTDFSELARKEQQELIMAVVPKLITRAVQDQGWRVKTESNLRYGTAPAAPMVTWVVRFTWDRAAQATPDLVYRDSLARILEYAGAIQADGAVLHYLD